MQQLKEHEQQQDNCSLTHMFWHHMLVFSAHAFFSSSRDLLGQRKCTFVGWVGGSGNWRGRRVVLAKRGCGGGGVVRRPSVRLGSEFFSIKVLYFILFSYSSFLFLFFLSFSLLPGLWAPAFAHYYCFFLSRGYLLLQRLCLLYIRSLNKFQSLRFPALLHSRFECRHATLLPPCREDRCVTTLITDV